MRLGELQRRSGIANRGLLGGGELGEIRRNRTRLSDIGDRDRGMEHTCRTPRVADVFERKERRTTGFGSLPIT
jgi:hypothetical protein